MSIVSLIRASARENKLREVFINHVNLYSICNPSLHAMMQTVPFKLRKTIYGEYTPFIIRTW